MSLYNVLRTGTSGMEAHATKLGTVAENIANVNTVGYKRADAEFSSLVLESGPNSYSSGAVSANIRYDVSSQGALTYTLSKTDVAIEGDGFFVVQDRNGGDFLTRAGSFVVDGQSGTLVNAAGFSLLGFPSNGADNVSLTLNDTAGLEPISLEFMNMRAQPSTSGEYRANLDADAAIVPAPLASANDPNSGFSVKSSIVVFDDLGREVTLDVYWTKTAADTWEVAVFDQSDATNGGFPYANAALATTTLGFDNTNGSLNNFGGTAVDVTDPNATADLSVTFPGGSDPLVLDLLGMQQLAAEFEPLNINVNGNAPATVQDVAIRQDGRVFAVYEDGSEVEFYRLPIANVPSPDQLSVLPGNVYAINPESGTLRIALPDDAGNGSLVVGALEQSNVDLASELTDMIVAQRGFTANSRSFQTGDDLLEVLVNLSR